MFCSVKTSSSEIKLLHNKSDLIRESQKLVVKRVININMHPFREVHDLISAGIRCVLNIVHYACTGTCTCTTYNIHRHMHSCNLFVYMYIYIHVYMYIHATQCKFVLTGEFCSSLERVGWVGVPAPTVSPAH